MKVTDYLNRKGFNYIEVRNNSGIQIRMNCPKCGDKDSFAINSETGAYNCLRLNKCGIKGSFTDFQRMFNDNPEYLDTDKFISIKKTYSTPNIKPEKANSKVIDYLATRKISEETVKKFRLGYLDNSILFPYHKDGKLVNVKYRSISEKKFRKEKDCMSTLFNQDNVKGDILRICEGEIDCMSFSEMGIDSVSIPSGVNDMTWIENDWDFIQRFNQIYIIMDNDKAGQSVVENLVNRLGKWKCKNVILPFKDANECLMQGLIKEDIDNYFDDATDFNLAELKSCNNFKDEIIDYKNNPNKLNGTVTSDPDLTQILHGWRNEEISIWTGQNSSGKSTFLSQEAIHLMQEGKKICIGSFEMPPRKFLWWLLKQFNRTDFMNDETVNKSLEKLSSKLYIIDILGVIKEDNLFEIMEFGFRKYGIDTFIIDSLMKIDLTSETSKLMGEQKKFVSKLKDFVSKYKSHIHLVAHPRKQEKDDSFVGKSDISGSGDITNLADNVFIIHRFSEEQKKTRLSNGKEPFDAMVIVKKNREFGEVGSVGFYFDKLTKRYMKTNVVDNFGDLK